MTLSDHDLLRLAELAGFAAREAGAMIAASRPVDVLYKDSGGSLASKVVTEVDRRSQDIILKILAPTLSEFDLGLLTEECEDDGSRFEKDYFWCIDPLDGTLPFIEGVPGYSVSIALVGRGGVPHIGVVFDPVTGELYSSIDNSCRSRGCGAQVLSFYADRSFRSDCRYDRVVAVLEKIAFDLGLVEGVRVFISGGAAMNACWVLDTGPACYFKFPKNEPGGGSLWDFAATACIFRAAGVVATDMKGRDLDLNRSDSTFMNHRGVLFASSNDISSRIRKAFGALE
jgi:myo-inositol-1(or 4)-monophosphatase